MEAGVKKDTEATYEKPEIREYGDLRELTTSQTSQGCTDVPSGTPYGNGIIFSACT